MFVQELGHILAAPDVIAAAVVAVLGLHSGGAVAHTLAVSTTAGTAAGTAWLYPLLFFAIVVLMLVLAVCLMPLLLV